MKYFIFIISTNDQSMLSIWWCKDIVKAVKFHKGLPTLIDKTEIFNKLVYVETADNEVECIHRFNELFKLTKNDKIVLIERVNPTYFDLVPSVNFDIK